MAQSKPIISNFTSGELSSRLYGRTDLKAYFAGAKTLRNVYVMLQGGVQKRPGTKYVYQIKDANSRVRLIPFEGTTGDRFILEMGDYYIRFYYTTLTGGYDGIITNSTGTGIYEIATIYPERDLSGIKVAQLGDIMYFTHPDYPVQKLEFYDFRDWRFKQVDFYHGPFRDENITDVNLAIYELNKTLTLVPSGDGRAYEYSYTGPTTYNYDESYTRTTDFYVKDALFDYSDWDDVSVGGSTTVNGTRSIYLDGSSGNAQIEGYIRDWIDDYEWTITYKVSGGGLIHAYATYAPSAGDIISIDYNKNDGNYGYYVTPSASFFVGFQAPSGQTAYVYDVDATPNIFDYNHIGSQWKLVGTREETKDVDAENTFTDAIKLEEGETAIFKVEGTWAGTVTVQKKYVEDTGNSYWYDVTDTTSNDTLYITTTDDKVYYRVGIKTGDYTSGTAELTMSVPNRAGYIEVKSTPVTAGNCNICIGDIIDYIPYSDGEKINRWSEGAWSGQRGYPTGVEFYENRLTFCGTDDNPGTVWGSQVNDYENFENEFNNDDESYSWTIKANKKLTWMTPHRILYMGNESEEWRFGDSSDATTPSSVWTEIQTKYGSEDIQPLQIGNTIIFVQRGGRKIRAARYDYNFDQYRAVDITFLSEHLFETGIKEIAYVDNPDSLLFALLNNGNIAVAALDNDYNIVGWTLWTTDGEFKNIATVETDDRAEIWVTVERVINGYTRVYVEQFQTTLWDDVEDAYFVDAALEGTYVGTETVSGLTHLEGETVAVNADGSDFGTYTVTGGSISFSPELSASKVVVGLPYTAEVETLEIESGSQAGTSQSRVKDIYRVFVRLYRTIGLKYGESGEEEEVSFYEPEQTTPTLYTGDKDFTYSAGYDRNATVRLIHDYPLPFTLLAIMPDMDTSDFGG